MVKINKLLKAGASMYDLEPSDLSTTLHYAVRANSQVAPEMIKLCLDAGININSTDIVGSTPLHTAINFNNYQIVPMLLSNGALLTAKDATGKTPLHRAVLNNPVNIEVLQTLIQAGADLEAQDNNGKTPLFDAVESGNLETIRTLLDAGADPNIQTKNSKTLYQAIVELHSADPSNFNNIKKLLNFYSYLKPGREAANMRKTLFGQSVINAYNQYLDKKDPQLLAKILGIDSSKEIAPWILKKAKKIFLTDTSEEPLFMQHLISDFNNFQLNQTKTITD